MRRILYIYMYVCVSSAHVHHGAHKKRSHVLRTVVRGWTFLWHGMAGERTNREVEAGGRLRILIIQVTAKHLVCQNKIPLGGEQTKQKHFR